MGGVSGARGEEVVRDVLGALGAEALGVGGVAECVVCGRGECRCELAWPGEAEEQRVWSRGVWRERDEYDDLD